VAISNWLALDEAARRVRDRSGTSMGRAVPRTASAAAPAAPPPAPAPRTYNPAAGWDVTKLNDPTLGTSTKYKFGRAAQDFTDWSRGNLQPLVDYFNKTYGGRASVVSGKDDSIDFGEGYNLDMINGETGGLQWLVNANYSPTASSQPVTAPATVGGHTNPSKPEPSGQAVPVGGAPGGTPGGTAQPRTAVPNGPSFGNPVLDTIAGVFRTYGHEPTAQEVSQWGTNIDAQFMRQISQAIRQRYAPAAPTAAPPAAPSTPPQAGGTPEFKDPWGAQLEQAVQERLKSLGTDPLRTSLDAYVQQLLQAEESKKANVGQFVDAMRGRITELQKPAYSEGDEAVLRAKAFDQFERRRQQTLKNNREQVYARGFEPTSGLVQEADQDTNQQFEEGRTAIESDLLLSGLQETQRRKDQALSLDQLIEQALSGADLSGLEMRAKGAEIENSLYQDRESRMREVLSTIGIPLDLMSQRQQMANQTLGLGGNPQSIMSSIMALLGFGAQNRAMNMQSDASNMAGLGQLLSILMPARQSY
jgi:hypothetical protein